MKHELAKKTTGIIVEVIPPAPELDAAGRINYYHRISREAGVIAIKAALAAGIEIVRVQLAKPGKLFDAWVEANCDFSRRTAFNYMRTVRATIAVEGDVTKLLEGSDDDRRTAIEDYAAQTDSKSLTELYADLGIVHKTPSNLGGKREGAGRKPKAGSDAVAALAAIAKDPALAKAEVDGILAQLYQFAVVRDEFGNLADADLAEALQMIREILAKGQEIAAARKARK